MSKLLVRRPSPHLADGELTHLERVPVDADRALRQWEDYVEVFRTRGWQVIEVPAGEEFADGVFIEDQIVIFGDVVVVGNAGADSRRGERAAARESAVALGMPVLDIVAPGTLDGGDVLKIGRTVYVGASSRTNAAGIAQLREHLAPRGWDVRDIPVSRVLHLKSGVTALPDGTVVGYEPLVDDPSLFPVFEGVPEEHGTAVVVLDERTVLMSADAPRTAASHRERGLEVITVDVSEFEKLEGCVTCLSVRVRD
ncbi:N(G),N(G)-dimethylarginine dimethylaminohydrolase [Microbacterium sediminicola]|uniref:N(G),N(G)-dimethylarginine dimethylaminohydrolase n=1 Tax=Microbacterium sediminicola TaxID=415210 RepID=A0ABP4TN63_9MICO